MTEERLPGGGKAWFVRRRKYRPFGATRWQIAPCSREGWLVVAGFVAINLLGILILLPEPTTARLIAWGTLETMAAVLFVVTTLRMSAPGWRDQ